MKQSMKRSTFALLACVIAAPAFAQSSVTVFGVAEAQVGSWKNLVAAPVSSSNPFGAAMEARTTTGMPSYGINASRIGFRGTEDLGDGMRAFFVLENQTALDSGSTPARFFHRQANVGLSGNWGQLKMGRVYSAWNDIASNAAPGYGDSYDPYVRVWRIGGPVPLGSPTANGSGQLTGLAGALGTNNDLGHTQNWSHVRMDKSIRYDTPNMSGFVASAQVNLINPDHSPASKSFALLYDKGPVRAGFGYFDEHTKSFYDTATGKYNAAAGKEGKMSTATFAFNYDFGPVKLVTMAGQSKYDVFSLGKQIKSTEWSVGAHIPMGFWIIKPSFAVSDSSSLTGKDSGAALEVHYLLSKRTTIYGATAWSKYDELLAGQTNRTSTLSVVGLRHMF